MQINTINKCCLLVSTFLLVINISFAQSNQNPTSGFEEMLDSLDIAIEQFVNGDAASFRGLWSHSEDITIAGGFGGLIEKGWTAIDKRLSRVGEAYKKTEFKTERIATKVNGNLGYLVQHEYFTIFGENGEVEFTRAYRVTMIFQLEDIGWRMIHRHADPSLDWKGME